MVNACRVVMLLLLSAAGQQITPPSRIRDIGLRRNAVEFRFNV